MLSIFSLLRLGIRRPVPAISPAPPVTGQEAQHRALMDVFGDGFCIIQFIDGPDGPHGNYVHIEANSGYHRPGGTFSWIEANGRVEDSADRRSHVFAGVLINIDERRAIEEDRDRAAAELQRLNQTLEERVQAQTTELMAQQDACARPARWRPSAS